MSLEGTPANTWRTPEDTEFSYLINTRTTSTVCGTANARFAKATVNDVKGHILFPDEYTHPAGVANIVNINVKDAAAGGGNTINASDWDKMEAAGAVFLPQAGYFDPNYSYIYGGRGYYWTSTANSTSMARTYLEQASDIGIYNNNHRMRISVRLIHDID